MISIQDKLDYADAIADWFLDIAESLMRKSNTLDALNCIYVAATVLSNQNRQLSSARIESKLHLLANLLPPRTRSQLAAQRIADHGAKCLHVMTEALPAGGHTAMAIRWIDNDTTRIHSVALISQKGRIPDSLLQAVANSGGIVHTADPTGSLLDRALWLRTLATDFASYVILHTATPDVVCGLAFGRTGGPPVLLVNHAGHAFWTGVSIADLVINCRGSALEASWTGKLRGASRQSTVPIPLLLPESLNPKAHSDERAKVAKMTLGLPSNSVVILTVGASFKYELIGDLDFVLVAESILTRLPNALLLVVGVQGDDRWRAASKRTGLRLLTLGAVSQSQLHRIHEAADVYIEGFPFGTTTSLLEAGLKGIPAVLAPAQCPPPYGSDGVALDHTLERPSTIAEYESKVVELCSDPVARRSCGRSLSESIIRHHTGEGWTCYLERAIMSVPREHAPANFILTCQTPRRDHEYWCSVSDKIATSYAETLETAFMRALSMGVKPRLTKSVLLACKNAKAVRLGRAVPLPLLWLFCRCLLPLLPVAAAENVFRALAFCFRGSFAKRLRLRMLWLFGGVSSSKSLYDEYRDIPKSSGPVEDDDNFILRERVHAARS